MSRSYRKPYATCGYGSKGKKWYKRYANKVIRHTEDVPNGKAYRKCGVNTWIICDYKFYQDSKPDTYWDWFRKEWVTEIWTPRWKAVRK